MSKFTYYDYSKALSYNAPYTFIVGLRGVGKTYGAKKLAIKNAIRKGEQFIYLRRFKTELGAKNTFFADVSAEFPDHEFKIAGNSAQMRAAGSDEKWATIGFFHTLSTAQAVKSVSYPLVTLIIFDEFILEKGYSHYLPDEAAVFNGFYSTVDRNKDKTRVLFLANSVSIMNPYFIEYKVQLDREFTRLNDGFILIHYPKSEQYAGEVLNTRFGNFVRGTAFGDFAIGNEFADGHTALLGDKTPGAAHYFDMYTSQGWFSVWLDVKASPQMYYVNEKSIPGGEVWVMDIELMGEGRRLMQFSDKALQRIRNAYGKERVLFASAELRNKFMRVFKR